MLILQKPKRSMLIKKAQNCKSANNFSYVTKNRFGKFKKVYYFNSKNNTILFNFLENPLRNYLIKQEFYEHYKQNFNSFYKDITQNLHGLSYDQIKKIKPVFTVKAKREILRKLVFEDENNLVNFISGYNTEFNKEIFNNYKLISSYALMLYEIKHNKRFIDDVIFIIENTEYDEIPTDTLQSALAKRYYKYYKIDYIHNLISEIAIYEARNKAQEAINLELTTANTLLKGKIRSKFDTINRILKDRINVTERVLENFKSSEASHFIWTLEKVINEKAQSFKKNLYTNTFTYISKKLFKDTQISQNLINDFVGSYDYVSNFEIALLEYSAEIKTILSNSVKISKLENDILKIKRINEKHGRDIVNINSKINKIFNLKTINEVIFKFIETTDKEKSVKNVLGSVASNLLLLNEHISKNTNSKDLNIYDMYSTNINNIKFETSIKRYGETSKLGSNFYVLKNVLNWYTNQNKLLSADFAKTENEMLLIIINKLTEEIRNVNVRVTEIINSYATNSKTLSVFVKTFVNSIIEEIETEKCIAVRYSKLLAYAHNLTEKGVIVSNDEFIKAVELMIKRKNPNYEAFHTNKRSLYPIYNYNKINLYDIINEYLKIRPLKRLISGELVEELEEEAFAAGVDSKEAVEGVVAKADNNNDDKPTDKKHEDNKNLASENTAEQQNSNSNMPDSESEATDNNLPDENAAEGLEGTEPNLEDGADAIEGEVQISSSEFVERDPEVVKAIEKVQKDRAYLESYTSGLLNIFKSASEISPETEKTLTNFYTQNGYIDSQYQPSEDEQQQYYSEQGYNENLESQEYTQEAMIDQEAYDNAQTQQDFTSQDQQNIDEQYYNNINDNQAYIENQSFEQPYNEVAENQENIFEYSNEQSANSQFVDTTNNNDQYTEKFSFLNTKEDNNITYEHTSNETTASQDEEIENVNNLSSNQLHNSIKDITEEEINAELAERYNIYQNDNQKPDARSNESLNNVQSVDIKNNELAKETSQTLDSVTTQNIEKTEKTEKEKAKSNYNLTFFKYQIDLNNVKNALNLDSNYKRVEKAKQENAIQNGVDFTENLTLKDREILSQKLDDSDDWMKKYNNRVIEKSRTYNVDDEKDFAACKTDTFWKLSLMAINKKIKLEEIIDENDLSEFKEMSSALKLFEIAASDNLNLSDVVLEKMGKLTFQQLARLVLLKYKDGKLRDEKLKEIINHLLMNTLAFSKTEEYQNAINSFLKRNDIKMVLKNGYVSLSDVLEQEIQNESNLSKLFDKILQKTAPEFNKEEKKDIEKSLIDGIIV